MPDRGILCCPRCRSDLGDRPPNLVCLGCGMEFPFSGFIPLLVPDPLSHEQALEEARAVNPQWYLSEQPPEQASPWRHHLRKRREYVQDALGRELAKRGLVRARALLDLGCGDGNNLKWLSDYTQLIYGSDYNLVRLTRAAALLPSAEFFLADVLRYPVKNDSFEVVFFNHVIEHIPDDAGALAEVRRMLKPGGLLILGTPNEGAWWWQWAYRNDPQALKTTDHVHFYTAPLLRQRLEQAGLKVTEIKHLGWGPPSWKWDMKLRGYKLLDDLFEATGKRLLPSQASSLYFLASKD